MQINRPKEVEPHLYFSYILIIKTVRFVLSQHLTTFKFSNKVFSETIKNTSSLYALELISAD